MPEQQPTMDPTKCFLACFVTAANILENRHGKCLCVQTIRKPVVH